MPCCAHAFQEYVLASGPACGIIEIFPFKDTEEGMHCHQQTNSLLMWQQQQGEIVNHGTTPNTTKLLDESLCCDSEVSFTVCCNDFDGVLYPCGLKGQLRYKCPALGICLDWIGVASHNICCSIFCCLTCHETTVRDSVHFFVRSIG